MYENLELSVNGKFIADGTMVKISATLKSSCVKTCYLIQKLEPATETVYLPPMFWQQIFSFEFGLLKI